MAKISRQPLSAGRGVRDWRQLPTRDRSPRPSSETAELECGGRGHSARGHSSHEDAATPVSVDGWTNGPPSTLEGAPTPASAEKP